MLPLADGLDCLEFFLTSSSGQALAPDAIMFNFGLHNLLTPGQSAVPGQSDFWTNYIQPLATITERLKALNTTLLFAITSPMLCDASQDDIVMLINTQAAALMQQEGIPTVNLHDAITKKCGPVPQASCFGETGELGLAILLCSRWGQGRGSPLCALGRMLVPPLPTRL
jgi:hypothetical protein